MECGLPGTMQLGFWSERCRCEVGNVDSNGARGGTIQGLGVKEGFLRG